MTDATRQDRAPALDLPAVVWLPVGALAAVVGLLPWIVTGMRLPLQNLWAAETLPGDMPVALLPFNQYDTDALFAMIVVAGGVAGVVARTQRAGVGAWIALGAAGVLVAAVAQSLVVVGRGLLRGRESSIYVVAVTAVILAALVVALLVGLEIGRGERPAVVVAAAVVGVALGEWVEAFPELSRDSAPVVPAWLPGCIAAAVAGLALAWCGWRPTARVAAWAGAVVVLWLLPAALETIVVIGANRVSPPFGDLFLPGRSALADGVVHGWAPAILAPVVGVVVRLAFDELRRRGRTQVTP